MNNPTLPSADVLETIIANIKPDPKHKKLLDALHSKTMMDSLRHAKTYDGLMRDGGVYDSNHALIHNDVREWFDIQSNENDNNPHLVWEKFKDLELLNSTMDGAIEYFVCPIGNMADEFIQLEVYCWREKITHNLFNNRPWSPVSEPSDLQDNGGSGRGYKLEQAIDTGNVYYEFKKIFIAFELIAKYNDIRAGNFKTHSSMMVKSRNPTTGQWEQISYADAFPEAVKSPSNPSRLIQDWNECSAGLGNHVFCDHWILTNTEWTDGTGKENMSIIPYWTTKKPITEIRYKKSITPYQLFDIAERIDKKSGYPFAWYFYMLHGNRVKDWFGVLMLKAAERGQIFMPEHDYQVLKRWNINKYGF
jgi:hypothetical protein